MEELEKIELEPVTAGFGKAVFKKHLNRVRRQKKFDKDEIHFIKCGKKINIYNLIQEGREDTEIYPTLEKYGCIDRMLLKGDALNEAYVDMTNAMDLRNSLDQMKAAENVWLNLPLETRREFNFNKHEFIENGLDWMRKKIDAEIAEKQSTVEPVETGVIKDAGK